MGSLFWGGWGKYDANGRNCREIENSQWGDIGSHPMSPSYICLSASQKFTEALGFYDPIVREPELFILPGELGVGVGLKSVLNNGGTDFIPDFNGIEKPRNVPCFLVKFEQTAECSKNRINIAAGNKIA